MMIGSLFVWSIVVSRLISSSIGFSPSFRVCIPFIVRRSIEQEKGIIGKDQQKHRAHSVMRTMANSEEEEGSRDVGCVGNAVSVLDIGSDDVDVDVDVGMSGKNWRECVIPEGGGSFHRCPFDDEDDDEDVEWSVEAYESSLKLYDELKNGEDAYLREEIQDSLEALGNAYRLYGPQNVIGSYNGGKDAVVIFHLLRAAHAHYYHSHNITSPRIRPRVIYFENKLEFPQVLHFLRSTVQQFDAHMLAFPQGTSFSQGLKILVHSNHPANSHQSPAISTQHPYPMAFVLGTRSSDPNAKKQTTYAPSSSYMPPFMRINPIIDFTYGHVWHFLRLFQLPYCSLYDEGYTSLGNINDTFPNPALKKNNASNTTHQSSHYWPAYMLRDWDQERAGRMPKNKQTNSTSTTNTPTISQNSSTVSLPSLQQQQQQTTSSTIRQNDEKIKKNVSFQKQPRIDDTTKDSVILQTTTTSTTSTTNTASDNDNNNDELSLLDNSDQEQKTVGLIIIGDEILKGLTTDTNTHVAAQALRSHNVPLERVVVVSDDIEQIVHEIQRMQKQVDIIITSGGVGPTHDDVTIKGISTALGSDMAYNQAMADLLLSKTKNTNENQNNNDFTLTTAQKKMAMLPTCAKLKYLDHTDDQAWPILQCANIFVLPGVPQFFKTKIQTLALYLSSEDIHFTNTFKVVLSIHEDSIVPILNDVVQRHVNVSFGSYPFVDHPECKTVVTLEARPLQGGYKRNSGRFTTKYQKEPENNTDDNPMDESISNRLNTLIQFSKDEMNDYVKLALTDLVEQLPKGSVLRVDNNDSLKSV